MARSLEDRYRRLLLAYPASYRRDRGDELLAVALDVAEAEGRHRPSVADALDLVGHGLASRASGWRTAASHPAARDALATAAVILPMLLATRLGRGARLTQVSLTSHIPDGISTSAWLEPLFRAYLPSALWLLAAIALCLGLVRTAKVLAPIAVIVQVADLASTSRVLLQADVRWLVSGAVAAALLLGPGLARRGTSLVGRSYLARLTAGIAAAVLVAQMADPGRGLGNGLIVWITMATTALAARRVVQRRVGVRPNVAGALTGLYVLVAGLGLDQLTELHADPPVELTAWALACAAVLAIPLAVVKERTRLRRAWGALLQPSA